MILCRGTTSVNGLIAYLLMSSICMNQALPLVFQTSLHYYSSLNALQYKRKCALLEPFLGYMHGLRAFFTMGHEAVAKDDIDQFLSNISASVQS